MTERRYDPVSGEWRTFAPQRQDRTFLPSVSSCPLCPTRDPNAPTEIPWPSFDVAVFDNRFPALTADPVDPDVAAIGPYAVEPACGATEVVVYSDDHHASLGTLGAARIRLVVDVWAERYAALSVRPDVAYVFIFENRGQEIGVTLHHPHGQIYAYPEVPPLPARELRVAREHLDRHGTCVLCDVVGAERADGARVVVRNESFLAYVPFAARFPYEVHVVAERHVTSLLDMRDSERDLLADMLERLLRSYDTLFGFPLPYVMSLHQAPADDGESLLTSHLHFEFTPIHRSASRLKYLAGSEIGAGSFLNDVPPEAAASELRAAVRRHSTSAAD